MRILYDKEAEDFLEKNGFPITKRRFVVNEKELIKSARELRYPLAIKIVSKKILHKSDVGGVIIDIRNDRELVDAFRKIKKIKHCEGALVQKYKKGYFLICGIKKDETFGHAVMIGSGDIYAEILKDVSFRVCPVNKEDIDEMIKEVKIYEILKGARGKKSVNFKKIKSVLLRLSNLAKKYNNIKELDINPLIVDENDAVIVDARIVFDY